MSAATLRQRSLVLEVDELKVEVSYKHMRTMRLRVMLGSGAIRLSAPWLTPTSKITQFVRQHRAWLDQQQQRIHVLPAISYRDGSLHQFLGQEHRLEWQPGGRKAKVEQHEQVLLVQLTQPSEAAAERALVRWFKERLSEHIDQLLAQWQPKLQRQASGYQIRSMRSRWGSCQHHSGKLCFALELIHHRLEVIEYVVVHELVHLIEANHSPRFYEHLSAHLPHWRETRAELKRR